jgi:hypothetical protein
MATAPKPVAKKAVAAKPAAKPVAKKPAPPQMAMPMRQQLPPGVNPAVAAMQRNMAMRARAADIASTGQDPAGTIGPRPEMPDDFSNTMRRVPASVQTLRGSAAPMVTPPSPDVAAQQAAAQRATLPAGAMNGFGRLAGGMFGGGAGGFAPRAAPAGGAFGPKGGAFGMKPNANAPGAFGAQTKAPGMTGQAQPFAGGFNTLNRGGSQ